MVTPSAAAERVIQFLEAHNAKQHWLSAWSAEHIRAAAAAATERYAAGKPLSVLDGVPFVVKDCIDALPYPTSCGTRFMGQL
jgi:Asp-tRNA(Asn)/Glu-tRNA(Gln) amidotransferase A subunit family amidase